MEYLPAPNKAQSKHLPLPKVQTSPHTAFFHPAYTMETRTSWANLHWKCFKRLVYISEQDAHIFLGVLKIMCCIFCTLLRHSVSEEKKMDFDNVTLSGVVYEAEILTQNMPVMKSRVYVSSVSGRGSAQSVIVNRSLLTKLLYFLPVEMTNEYQHNVLEHYNVFTHFPFWLIK